MTDVISEPEAWEVQYYVAVDKHARDIKTIGEALIKEADDRGWCEMYDKFVNDLNDKLFIQLPTRKKRYKITQRYTVVRSITVEAPTEDDAFGEVDTAYDLDDLTNEDEWDIDVEFNWQDAEED